MGLGTLLLGGLAIALGGAITYVAHNGGRAQSMKDAEKLYKTALNNAGVGDITLEQVVNLAYNAGYIDPKDYNKYISEVHALSQEGVHTFADTNAWKSMSRGFWETDKQDQYADFYNKLAEFLPNLKDLTRQSLATLPDTVLKEAGYNPSLYKTPSIPYQDTSFKTYQREVDPVKLWTGQELADLHNINYDVNHYYDLIKQANEANLAYGNYTNAQTLNTTRRNDEQRIVSYLDALRNVKSDAVANGTAAGARAAQEVLANVAASNERANALSDTLNNNMANINDYILANAKSRLSAVDYFNQLAKSLSQDSATLYANDTNRFGADWNANAILYQADQRLRGERALANATMEGAAASAQAYINAANSNINTLAEQIKYIANSSKSVPEARARINDAFLNQTTKGGIPTVLDLLNYKVQ